MNRYKWGLYYFNKMTYLRSGKTKKSLVITQLKQQLDNRANMSVTNIKKVLNIFVTYKDILFDDETLKNTTQCKIKQFYNEGYEEFDRFHYLLYGEHVNED